MSGVRKRFKLRDHLQNFFGACDPTCCVVSAKEKVQVAPTSFKKAFVFVTLKKCCCNTAVKSDSFKFMFKQQNSVKFQRCSSTTYFCNKAMKVLI